MPLSKLKRVCGWHWDSSEVEMPILDIEIVLQPEESIPSNLARELADKAGAIFGSKPAQTWVKLREIEADHYAENDVAALEFFPVFVSVLKADLPSGEVMEAEVKELTQAIADICHRPPENVHIVYLPPGRGRVAFGGKLV